MDTCKIKNIFLSKIHLLFFCIQGGQAWFGPVLNSAVHVVMYAYYGLSVIPSLRDKLWWKKYITMFQLVSTDEKLLA
jgi:hypothetical protein